MSICLERLEIEEEKLQLDYRRKEEKVGEKANEEKKGKHVTKEPL